MRRRRQNRRQPVAHVLQGIAIAFTNSNYDTATVADNASSINDNCANGISNCDNDNAIFGISCSEPVSGAHASHGRAVASSWRHSVQPVA
mmetsp:Transcript_83089/g.214075  ORF Transcript_83089/g.214075 Transcript_83089/m.214075 type:complete len:90 (+) Transcript_83089:1847-2116(+)